jgi:hypothetical protein
MFARHDVGALTESTRNWARDMGLIGLCLPIDDVIISWYRVGVSSVMVSVTVKSILRGVRRLASCCKLWSDTSTTTLRGSVWTSTDKALYFNMPYSVQLQE